MVTKHTIETGKTMKNDLRKNEILQSGEYQCFDFQFTFYQVQKFSQKHKNMSFLDSFEKNLYFCALKCPDNQFVNYPDFRKSAKLKKGDIDLRKINKM